MIDVGLTLPGPPHLHTAIPSPNAELPEALLIVTIRSHVPLSDSWQCGGTVWRDTRVRDEPANRSSGSHTLRVHSRRDDLGIRRQKQLLE